jgi:hypothetical protein
VQLLLQLLLHYPPSNCREPDPRSRVIVPRDVRPPGNCGPRALCKPQALIPTACADQLHYPRLVRAVATDQRILNKAKI